LFFTYTLFIASTLFTCASFPSYAQTSQSAALGIPSGNAISLNAVKHMIGQKLILDIRYFCEDNTPSKQCRKPVTAMPGSLLTLLSNQNIGGIILFSENIENASQLISLNYSLQAHMQKAGQSPLFIAIDQEGGRVARLPHSILPAFAGNLAIGASAHQHGNIFAKNVGEHIGKTLLPLGINTNFAPSIDINSEPKNPVINVRSFGENPVQTAELGEAFVSAMQKAGVLSAVKHFPGHGDTHVDSHSGLPRVDHTLQEAQSGDLLPFANIINSATPPAMVMTAHIQYPALDDTTIRNKKGELQVVPATLSKRILTNTLRNSLRFNGLIITDALDMAGISQFFTEEDAVLRAFDAGADIALMPYTIRNGKDIEAFSAMIERIAIQTMESGEKVKDLKASYQRILRMKQHNQLARFVSKPKSWWLQEVGANREGLSEMGPNTNKPKQLAKSNSTLFIKGNQIEKGLSEASVTVLFGKDKLPVNKSKWLALMPDAARCLAFEKALYDSRPDAEYACLPLTVLPNKALTKRLIAQTDLMVIGDITPLHANYELGGADQKSLLKQRANESDIKAFSIQAMQTAKSLSKPVVFAALRMPYSAKAAMEFADIGIATYDYAITISEEADGKDRPSNKEKNRETDTRISSQSLRTLIKVLVGKLEAKGQSPVIWK
jgi:beta-N-acetylhexosaminidase